MKDDRQALINEHAGLYVRGSNKNGRTRYLACDPAETEENWTWTTKGHEAHRFELTRLPELLGWVRGKGAGYAVKLSTIEADCTLAELVRVER